MTKISGCLGTVRSFSTRTRPPRSVSAFSHLPAGDGVTPAVQITVLLVMRSPATITPSSSTLSTVCPKRISTPNFSRWVFTALESCSENVPSGRGPASTSTIRADDGSMRRNSDLNVLRTRSAIAPAISTPVGPAPTKTNVSRSR